MCASTLFPRSYEEAELQSKCGGDIFIQVADQATGTRVLSDIPDVHLEVNRPQYAAPSSQLCCTSSRLANQPTPERVALEHSSSKEQFLQA